MHLDSTLRRVSRGEGSEIGSTGGPVALAFMLATSLAACVGNIDTGAQSAGGDPNRPKPIGGGGGTGMETEITGPSACKPDQIGLSPLRRLTRIEYDNSIKDLLGVDLALADHFSEDELE